MPRERKRPRRSLAPDLLAACEALLTDAQALPDQGHKPSEDRDMVVGVPQVRALRAAIAKARGTE